MSDLLGNPDSFLQQGTERPAEDFSSAEDQSPDIPPAELDSVEVTNADLERYKKQLVKFGIFSLILVACMAFLILFSLIARNSWQQGLRGQVQECFASHGKKVSVHEGDKLRSVFSVSAASFKVDGLEKDCHAVIIRITTLYGPVAALYTCTDDEFHEVQFVDFLKLSPKVSQAVKNSSLNSQIAYWEKAIPKIVQSGMAEANNEN
ncbi:MAG: hypothetical protein J6P28_09620 [Treponema sp.]|nr:hypothetical protein [Treponema sp.]MBQ1670760.1 hypothetical protein [Treponema sp.]MBQ2207617.1 hypothetical protein [Treponema sp.]